jgi:hypothetical protein
MEEGLQFLTHTFKEFKRKRSRWRIRDNSSLMIGDSRMRRQRRFSKPG